MNTPKRKILLALSAAFLAASLAACGKEGGTPGEKLDRALDKTGEKVKDAGEAIKPR